MRSSIARASYPLAVVAGLLAACGGGGAERPPASIPVAGEPIARDAYARPLGAAVEPSHAVEDRAYRRVLTTRFTSVTPENAMKWAVVEPERGRFDFRAADAVVEYAERTGKRVRGHPLVWDEQLPAWLEEGDWEPAALRRVLRRHVRRLVSRYRGRVAEWDVVNEPLASDGRLERSLWLRVLGPGYIEIVFRTARAADPDARLFLNEIGAETAGRKSRALLEVARRLVERGVPIDGVGLQNHALPGSVPGRARLASLLRRLRELDLDGAITEMDVADVSPRVRRRAYADAAAACAGAANCTGLTLWGVTDRFSWRGADSSPLPFDANGEPKPVLEALLGPLR